MGSPCPRVALKDPCGKVPRRAGGGTCVHCLSSLLPAGSPQGFHFPRGQELQAPLGTANPAPGARSSPPGEPVREPPPWAEIDAEPGQQEVGWQSTNSPSYRWAYYRLHLQRRKTFLCMPVSTPSSGAQEQAASTALSS